MYRIDDAKVLLISASNKLSNIKTLYNKCEYDDSLSSELRLEIKYFLESIRSCLDYTTNYIFDTRCKQNFSENELRKVQNQIYFPNKECKKSFDSLIRYKFKGLDSSDQIVLLWENNQFFNQSNWVSNLCKLTNPNKHIELVKNTRTESGFISHMQIGGLIIENCTFSNCGHTIGLDNKPLSIKEFNTHPSIRNYNGTIKADYNFSATNTPIIPTLEEILEGATIYFDEFYKLL